MFENIRNVITRLPMDRLRPNLGGHIPSFLRHVPPRFGCHNGALKILQLWASGDRTRVPILIKFGTRQHVMTRTTITWLNIKILKIQNGGRPLCWKYIRNAITRLPMDGLGRNLGGRIPSCPRHVRHDAVAMATATAYQRRIEHSAVMGVLRPNAWTNFDDIRNTTARWDRNDSRMIKYLNC